MSSLFEKQYPSALNRDADNYMTHAYNEAIDAWEKDEVPIGAVIEHKGRIQSVALGGRPDGSCRNFSHIAGC